MITNAFRMSKSSSKLLLRGKGFLVIGILIPFVATLLINIWSSVNELERTDSVYELPQMDAQMAYLVNFNCLPVKIYDRANNDESKRLCIKLIDAGMFQIFRVDCSNNSME